MKLDLTFGTRLMLGIASCALSTLTAVAQEVEPSRSESMTIVAADDENGGPPMIISTMSSSIDGRPVISFGGPGESLSFLPGIAGMGPADPLSLIHNSDIQKEIELDGQQLDDYKELASKFKKEMQARSLDLRDGKLDPEKMKEFAQSMKELQVEQSARVKDLLLPHQFDRLKQISTQQHLQNAGTAAALTGKRLAEQLGLTEEQQERLKKRSEEVAKELQEKIEALRAEAQEQILTELTKEQRAKLEVLTGKNYTFKVPESLKLNESIRRRIDSRLNSDHPERK